VETAFGLIFSLSVLGFVAFTIGACLKWVIGPLERAAKNRQYPVQYSLADLLCVFVLVQLVIGLTHWAAYDSQRSTTIAVLILDVVFVAVAVVVWWKFVRTLSRAGIHVVWHRCVILVIILPAAVVGSMAVLFLFFAAIAAIQSDNIIVGIGLLLAEIPVVGIQYAMGRFTRRIVASAEKGRDGDREGTVAG
jgi:hypothetical protein